MIVITSAELVRFVDAMVPRLEFSDEKEHAKVFGVEAADKIKVILQNAIISYNSLLIKHGALKPEETLVLPENYHSPYKFWKAEGN